MPGFVKPTRKVVNIEDAFGELIGKKLIKDLHDNEEICPVCHGTGLRIEDNPYGLSDDPDKRAGQFPYKHQSIRFCPNCYNGVVRFCPDCGKQIPRCRTLCDCDAVVQRRQQEENRKEKERLEKAEKHEPNALGSLFTMAQSDFYSHNEGYFSCWEDFFDSWNEDREEFTGKPLYVWGTEEVEMSFDASSIVSNACEDKLASPCVINEEATFEAVKELMEAWGVDFSETDRWGDPVFDMDEIKDCCYQSNERDVHDALERKFEGTSMETCDDYDLWGCIQKDFTTNAKKIVQVFMDHIRPMCKKLSLSDVQIAEADKDGRLVALPSDKALTNADRMRAATNQQLAKLLYDYQKEFCRLMYKNLGFEDELTFSEDYSDILAWLNAPAEMGVVQDKDE